ncbi:hypothetical protein [Heyndrickxia sporothermodurans]|uniref:hypothetical protein n=1 Tax=Heyndrickxia sporothermodurans TaxID=46224 RepID=UPI0035D6B87A
MNEGEKVVHGIDLKKYRPIIYLLVLTCALVIFRHVLLQFLLTIFLIGCIGFILFKAIKYIFKFGFFVLNLSLSIIALVLAAGGILWLLNLLN